MADARYDPNAFRTLLEKINEAQTGDAPRSIAFVFNHPQSQTLSPEIADEIDRLAASTPRARAGNEFRGFRSALLKVPLPSTKPAIDSDADASGTLPKVFTHGMDFYRLTYPEGWQVVRTGTDGAMIAPPDGISSR